MNEKDEFYDEVKDVDDEDDDDDDEFEDEEEEDSYQVLKASSQISSSLSSDKRGQCKWKQEAPFENVFSIG